MKAQVSLEIGAVRPTQGKTLAVTQALPVAGTGLQASAYGVTEVIPTESATHRAGKVARRSRCESAFEAARGRP